MQGVGDVDRAGLGGGIGEGGPRQRFGQRPARPAATMSRATRSFPQQMPSRRSWPWILGAP